MSFSDAIALSESMAGERHILLGNGFSIAYDAGSFSYGRLLEEADFSRLSIDVRAVFEAFGTSDFEKIIEVLRTAAILLRLYSREDVELADRIARDSDRLKDALAQVLASRHPDYVGAITPTEFTHARNFLSHFKRIYTLNYDLLLYWTTMQDTLPTVPRNDGFSESEDSPGAEYVVWNPVNTFSDQRVFYLHGALHLFDAGTELRKVTWTRTGVPLVEQIRASLAEEAYPLVVTEGTSAEKYERILHSAYLNHALRSFSSIRGTLFLYGMSLASNDDHILRRIESGGISALFVGLYGSPSTEANVEIMRRAEALGSAPGRRRSLDIYYYDAASAEVWRSS